MEDDLDYQSVPAKVIGHAFVAQWQPIGTAPKDGRDLLFAFPKSRLIEIAHWWEGDHGDGPGWLNQDGHFVEGMTHWMACPPLPED